MRHRNLTDKVPRQPESITRVPSKGAMSSTLTDAELLDETRIFLAALDGILDERKRIEVPGRLRAFLQNSALHLLVEDEGMEAFVPDI